MGKNAKDDTSDVSPLRALLKRYFGRIIASLGVLFVLMILIIVQLIMEEINAGAQELLQSRLNFILILVIGGLVCTACLGVTLHSIGNMYRFFDKQITLPLEKISQKTSLLAKGQLNLKFDCESGVEEIVRLRNSMEFAVEELSRYVAAISYDMGQFAAGNMLLKRDTHFLGDFKPIEDSIDTFSDNISEVLRQVENAANTISDSSEQITMAAQDLANSNTTQAESVQVLTEKSETIADSVEQAAQNTKEVNGLIGDAGEIVTLEKEKMSEVSNAMNEISECSKEISAILETIDAIANETNLLSLNASIEAARAGTAGAGFAVVANSIRTLASESKESAVKIHELIEVTLKAVDNGNDKVKETAETLDTIVDITQNIARKMQQVTMNTAKITEETKQVTEETQSINESVMSTSAVSQENYASSTELSNQAQVLKELTQKFKLKKT